LHSGVPGFAMLAASARHVVARRAKPPWLGISWLSPAARKIPAWRCLAATADIGAGSAASSCVLKPGTTSAHKELQYEDDAAPREQCVRSFLTSRRHLYWKLAKGKLTVFATLSGVPGYLLCVPGAIDPCLLTSLFIGTLLTSSSAQAMNQIYEVPRDALMKRTADRPLPSGRMSAAEASAFAAATGSIGLGVLAFGINPATAGIAGATMALYVGAYTPLKVLTPYNTHVGAISGSLPTLLGFTAALSAGVITSPWGGHALWLFAMQTLWQMPHFYALAWIYRADYIKGGYNMFPLSDSTGHKTAAMSKPYLVAMCAMPWAASSMGLASWMLPIGAAVPSALWWRSLKKFEQNPSAYTCRRFFLGSLSYLMATLMLFTAYARAEQPAEAIGNVDDSEDRSSPESLPQFLEPAWRANIRAFFAELCPHEKMRLDLLGALSTSCPFTGTKSLE